MKSKLAYIGLLLAIGFLVHGVSINNPYFYDDIEFIQNNPWVGKGSGLNWYRQIFFDAEMQYVGYRPTLMLSFDLNAQLFGKTPASFRFFNILFHCLNSILIFLLIPKLLRRKENESIFAFFVAALFLVHPIQTLAINFLWKRSTILSSFFLLSALLTHIKALSQKGKNRILFHSLEVILFLLSLTSKETAVIYILFTLVYDFLISPTVNDRKNRIAFSGFLSIITISFAYFRLEVVEKFARSVRLTPQTIMDTTSWIQDKILVLKTNITIIVDYFFLLVFPKPLLIDDMNYVHQFPWISILPFLVLLFLPVLFYFRSSKNKKLAALVFSFFWFPLLPTTSLFPTYFIKDQIRLYLPVLAYSLLLVWLTYLFLSQQQFKKRILTLSLITLVFSSVSFIQNDRYGSPLLVWGDVLDTYPDSVKALNNMSAIYVRKNKFKESYVMNKRASEIEPQKPGHKIRMYISQALAKMDTVGALEDLHQIKSDDLMIQDRIDLGVAYFVLNEIDQAEQIFLSINDDQPYLVPVHMNLAQIWEAKGEKTRAKQAYENVLKIDPKQMYAKQRLEQLKGQVGSDP